MPSVAQAVALVRVYDYLTQPTGSAGGNAKPVQGVVVTLTPIANAQSINPVTQVPAQPVQSTVSDGNGYWEAWVVPTDNLNPSGMLYQVDDTFRSYRVNPVAAGIPGPGWQSSAILVNAPSGLGVAGFFLPGGTVVNGTLEIQGVLQVDGYLRQKGGPDFDITAYGGAMDARQTQDGGITVGQAIVSSASIGFTQADVGKVLAITGAGAAGVVLQSTIVSVQSATQATIAAVAGTTVAGHKLIVGTDNGPAFVSAYNAAIAAGGGTLTGPVGSGIMLAPFAVNSTLISMRLQGVGSTTFYYVGAARAFEFQINPFNVGQAGEFYGWTVDGTFAQPGAVGWQWGEMTGGEIDDIVIQNFTAGPASAGSRPSDGVSVGMYWVNRTNWTERTHMKRVWLSNNSIDWLVDVNGSAFNSMGYTRVKDLRLNTNANQIGMKFMGNVNMYNAELVALGNYVGPTSTFWQMGDTATATNGNLQNTKMLVTAELMNGPGGANGLIINNGSTISGAGLIALSIGTPVNTNNGIFSVSGSLSVPGIITRNGSLQAMGGFELGTAGVGSAAIQQPGAWSDGTSLFLSALNAGAGGIVFRPRGSQSGVAQGQLSNNGSFLVTSGQGLDVATALGILTVGINNAGTIQIGSSTTQIGIGTPSQASEGILVAQNFSTSGGLGVGIRLQDTIHAIANNDGIRGWDIAAGFTVDTGTFTGLEVRLAYINGAFTVQGTGAIATAYGMRIDAPTAGTTNFGLYVNGNTNRAFTVAPAGSANFGLQVDESVASAVTGLKIAAQAAGGGIILSAISTGAAEDITLTPKGTGLINAGYGTTALGAGGAATLGNTGGTGPATAAQNSWLAIKINGTTSFIPVWR